MEGFESMTKKHKVLLLLFLPALVLWGSAFILEAQEKAEDNPAPRIHFPESVHDFGTISRGGHISHVFSVRNTGSAPLELLGVKDT